MLTTTPRQGLEDNYLSVGGKWLGISFSCEWHRFNSDTPFATTEGETALHYGSEFDLGAAYNITKKLMGKLELANFKRVPFIALYASQIPRKPGSFWFNQY